MPASCSMRTESPSGATISSFATPKRIAYNDIRGIKAKPMGWSGKGRFWGASDPRYWFPLDIHRGNQTDPAGPRCGPLGEAVHHSRKPRTRHCRRCATGYGPADRRGAARAAGRAPGVDRGQRRPHLRVRPVQHRRRAAVHHRPVRPDDWATRTADDDGGDRPDRRGICRRHARQCDRAKEVDGAASPSATRHSRCWVRSRSRCRCC